MRDHRTLAAWQCARRVVRGVLLVSRRHWVPWGSAVFGQVQRASLSVQLNIAEGYAWGRSPSRLRHFRIAYGSAVETSDLLAILGQDGLVPEKEIGPLLTTSTRTQRLLHGLIRTHLPDPDP